MPTDDERHARCAQPPGELDCLASIQDDELEAAGPDVRLDDGHKCIQGNRLHVTRRGLEDRHKLLRVVSQVAVAEEVPGPGPF